jgi:hypothetical protein
MIPVSTRIVVDVPPMHSAYPPDAKPAIREANRYRRRDLGPRVRLEAIPAAHPQKYLASGLRH